MYVDSKVSLGHIHQAIIDLTEKGHQPIRYKKKMEEEFTIL